MNDSNRRNNDRLQFHCRCILSPMEPAWARLSKPVEGETVNITEHGVRAEFSDFSQSRFEKWQKCLDDGENLDVMLTLASGSESLDLEGHIVWVHFQETDVVSGICSVGILLSLMDSDIQGRVRTLVQRAVGG